MVDDSSAAFEPGDVVPWYDVDLVHHVARRRSAEIGQRVGTR